jgi:hypothetical protein
MGADKSNRVKFRSQRPELSVIREVEVENDDLCSVTVDDVTNLVNIPGYADIPEIGMKLSGKMLSDDAVGLSDYDVMVNHGSLT